jgi:hypothetical protein
LNSHSRQKNPARTRRRPRLAVPRFNRLDGIYERFFQNTPAYRAEHQAKQATSKILAVAHHSDLNIAYAVWRTPEVVGVA